ncbi:MAG: SpoIIE family protein phosphatase [Ruminococcus sp.]|nr:SpoIIE family protein phosphatase [Ruminococcus sp.]
MIGSTDMTASASFGQAEASAASTKKKEQPAKKIAPLLAAMAAGWIYTGVRLGGSVSVFGISFAAALPAPLGFAALMGGVMSAIAGGNLWQSLPWLTAMGIMAAYNLIFRRRGHCSRRLTAAVSGAVSFVCIAAVNAGSGGLAVFAAALIRGGLCLLGMLCFFDTLVILKHGCKMGGDNPNIRAAERLGALGAVYMITICSLVPREIGIFNMGRIAAGIFCAAAARKFGAKGGAAAGILSGTAFLLCDPGAGRSGVILAFAAMAAGMCGDRGKYTVDTAFILSAFAVTAAAGMPSGTPAFIADMGAAAVLYCIIPESVYIGKLSVISADTGSGAAACSNELKFTKNMLTEVINDVEDGAGMLARVYEKENAGKGRFAVSETVRERVCASICTKERCSAVIGCAPREISQGCFRAAQGILEKKGSITGKELPAGFEGCTKKNLIAWEYNTLYGVKKIQSRKRAGAKRFLDNISRELYACGGMMSDIAEDMDRRREEDKAMSEAAFKVLRRRVGRIKSVRVTYDGEGRPFCEAYFTAPEKFPDTSLARVTARLGELLGEELEKPALLCCGRERGGDMEEGEQFSYRARWWSGGGYYPDFSVSCHPAEGGVCGDSSAAFEDGRGNFYLILSDGMGTGHRAAAQSSLAVSVLRRLILAGASPVNGVKMLNVLMSCAGADETFTTVDLLKINCLDGRASLIKMGAAPTAVICGGEVEVYSGVSAPVGILDDPAVEEIFFDVDNTARIIMVTDGVGEGCSELITALLQNDRLTPEQTADKLKDFAVNEGENSTVSLPDDVTVGVIRLLR